MNPIRIQITKDAQNLRSEPQLLDSQLTWNVVPMVPLIVNAILHGTVAQSSHIRLVTNRKT